MGHNVEGERARVSYGAVEVRPVESTRALGRRRGRCYRVTRFLCPSDLSLHCKSMVFLLVQSLFALCAGLLLWTAMLLCLVLLPLCGLGVFVFTWLFRCGIVDFIAKYDAAMVNFVVPRCDQIQIGSSDQDPFVALLRDFGPADQLVSGLHHVSVESVMVLVYFLTFKPILSAVGVGVVAITVGLPVLLLTSALYDPAILVGRSASGWEIVCIYTTLVLVFFVAVMSMDLVVDFSSAMTRFFCCEQVYMLPIPQPGATSVATTTNTRSNVVVVRIPPSSATGVYAFASSQVRDS